MNKETIIYALPKDEVRPYMEEIISTNCKTQSDINKVIEVASKDGYHSFRISNVDFTIPPEFIKAVNI